MKEYDIEALFTDPFPSDPHWARHAQRRPRDPWRESEEQLKAMFFAVAGVGVLSAIVVVATILTR